MKKEIRRGIMIQGHYLVSVTEREVRAVGYQRYIRKNRKKPITVCLLLVVIAVAMMAFTPAIWAMIVYSMCLVGSVVIALRLISKAEKDGKAFLGEVKDNAETR